MFLYKNSRNRRKIEIVTLKGNIDQKECSKKITSQEIDKYNHAVSIFIAKDMRPV